MHETVIRGKKNIYEIPVQTYIPTLDHFKMLAEMWTIMQETSGSSRAQTPQGWYLIQRHRKK